MAFCEQCGTELVPGSRFCEECGAAIDDVFDPPKETLGSTDGFKEIFIGSDWMDDWGQMASKAGNCELGIILTRENALLCQIDVSREELHGLLGEYINKASKRGVKYVYFDLDKFPGYDGDGDVDSVVAALRDVVDVARPKYLFILGNEKVVEVVRWENRASDGDAEVESDLCYSTLDLMSPWEGQKYDFDSVLRVGRLPTYSGENFSEFKSYFETAAAHIGQMNRVVSYGLSALVWEEESNYEFGKISSRNVDVSPDVEHKDVSSRMGSESNLLFFNLHGSDRAKYWYGQDGGDYPEAFAPEVLTKISRPYFLGVEACYGARYLGGLMPEESILLTAMQNKCIAFLGSSRIAFGTSSPFGSCADFVIGSYVSNLKKGESAGDAHLSGLKRLTENWDSMDDSDLKTMAEFALYGDPSARMGSNGGGGIIKGIFSSHKIAKGLSVPMPDVRRAVRMSIIEVDSKINAIIDEYVKREILPEISGIIGSSEVKTKTLKMEKSGLFQKVYSFNSGSIGRVAKIYFDERGAVKKAIVSK